MLNYGNIRMDYFNTCITVFSIISGAASLYSFFTGIQFGPQLNEILKILKGV